MEKLIVYFVSRVYAEIPKKRAYSPMVFVEGSAFSYEGTEDEYAEFLTFSLSEAKEHLRKLKTEMWDFVQYMWIKEWGLIERVYDFDGIKKDFPEIQTKEDFLQKLTEDPWGDLAQYEIDFQSGWIHEYSKREYEAFLKKIIKEKMESKGSLFLEPTGRNHSKKKKRREKWQQENRSKKME